MAVEGIPSYDELKLRIAPGERGGYRHLGHGRQLECRAGALWVVGGTRGPNHDPVTDVYAYDPQQHRWLTADDRIPQLPEPRAHAALVATRNPDRLYLIGGNGLDDSKPPSDPYRYPWSGTYCGSTATQQNGRRTTTTCRMRESRAPLHLMASGSCSPVVTTTRTFPRTRRTMSGRAHLTEPGPGWGRCSSHATISPPRPTMPAPCGS